MMAHYAQAFPARLRGPANEDGSTRVSMIISNSGNPTDFAVGLRRTCLAAFRGSRANRGLIVFVRAILLC